MSGLAVSRIERRADTDSDALAGAMLMALFQQHGPVGWCDAASGISDAGVDAVASRGRGGGALEPSNISDVDGEVVVAGQLLDPSVGAAAGGPISASPRDVKEIVDSLGPAEKELLGTQTQRVSMCLTHTKSLYRSSQYIGMYLYPNGIKLV